MTLICSSLISFLDLCENRLLKNQHIHCIFQIDAHSFRIIQYETEKHQAQRVTFSGIPDK